MRRLHSLLATAVIATTALPAAAAGRVPATAVTTATAATATVSGRVTAPGERGGLEGMQVAAVPTAPASSCPATDHNRCGPITYTGPRGTYSLAGLTPGTYTLRVLDGSATVRVASVKIGAHAASRILNLTLPAPAVPAGTASRASARDLRRLNAERARDGLPAGVVLNPRWSDECAAHDAYEADNDVLSSSEDRSLPGASVGGAWAGLNGALAEGRWTARQTPWENAPIHLLALMAPSLSVTGIDDTGTLQCAVTFPGMLRTPVKTDAISTVPGPGADDVAGSETARESPFTPVQFAGLPADQPTGRELLVYLNVAGRTGQAPVHIVRASLKRAGHPVAVRWVDTTTRTLGPYLAGGIVIPVDPLRSGATYRASVAVRDGARTLTHSWSFTTR